MSQRKGVVKAIPTFQQLVLFNEAPNLVAVINNTVMFNGRRYEKRGNGFYETIAGREYQAYGESLLIQLQDAWLRQNSADARLFIEQGPNHQL